MAAWQVGIDIGGTFTDVTAVHEADGVVRSSKVPSQSRDPLQSLLAALAAVGLEWGDVADLVHGTTIVTNAIVEDRLESVALVATVGFSDVLAIGRQNRRFLYRLDLPPKLPSPVPEDMCLEIGGRLDHTGAELAPLHDKDVERLVRQVRKTGAATVAVSLLHAYANPAHEQALGCALRKALPHVALSHEVNPEAREFERTGATVLSASVMPLVADYIDKLEARRPARRKLHFFHSAGGMASPASLRNLPLSLAMSGPAAGVTAASRVARDLGIDNAISFDMGGTTTDVCLIRNGEADISNRQTLGSRPLRVPMVAVDSIGAGGGSIASFEGRVPQVGPRSAGARPGPACYGLGGVEPTVCDADIVLGYIEDGSKLGGGIVLRRDLAERAIAPLAKRMGFGIEETALGIARIANDAMSRALRRVTVERGVDGRNCTLIAFGGAGPMHAVEVARIFGIRRVVVPAYSGAFSALGCVTAEMSYTHQQTVRMAGSAWNARRLAMIRKEIVERLRRSFGAGAKADLKVVEVAALRYRGQSYSVEVDNPPLDDARKLQQAFATRHLDLYGFANADDWELEAIRITVSRPRALRLAQPTPGERPAPAAGISIFEIGGSQLTPRHPRASLEPGQTISGPAIVRDSFSTVVLPPRTSLACDAAGNLLIDLQDVM